MARGYKAAGVRHIVALRGDPPAGVGTAYAPHPGGYANAADLVAGLKQIGDFEISVAGYPEKHPDSRRRSRPISTTSRPRSMPGAARVITQFFFDNAHFLRFLEAARARGIWAPIVPGIVPIHNFKQVAGFAGRCGATMPSWLARRFDGLDADPQTTHLVAAAVAAEQVMDLVDQGIRQFHFYTLNRADLVYAICHLLGLRPEPAARQGGRQRMSMTREQRIAALKAAAHERILIIDGAMGTMIQRYKFDEAAFRGDALRRPRQARARATTTCSC